ncbi:MAG: hypothetical protein HC905_15585 [Bacteroidales bacterium]|nr:hypothetical protein [Bacteroidales bacterium]
MDNSNYKNITTMKCIPVITIIIGFFFWKTNLNAQHTNVFSSKEDTLALITVKEKGYSIFRAGAGQIYFEDTAERYDYPVVFPKNVTDIKLGWHHIDIKPFQFENLKREKSDLHDNFPEREFPV